MCHAHSQLRSYNKQIYRFLLFSWNNPIEKVWASCHQPPIHTLRTCKVSTSLLYFLGIVWRENVTYNQLATQPHAYLAPFDTPEPQLRWRISIITKTHTTQFLLEEKTSVDEISHHSRLDVAKKLADILETVHSFQCLSTLINVAVLRRFQRRQNVYILRSSDGTITNYMSGVATVSWLVWLAIHQHGIRRTVTHLSTKRLDAE